ncbi:hypothetical protein SAY87_011028 [Trapa incisa]|uniref:Uncharacterized protein n=1 Tax=Trapa incisa TaxID=236973 RepID=A0AAN7GFH5_9MYRT|nr:hypothetical protein SAY87_011028 [Trapa incisa]
MSVLHSGSCRGRGAATAVAGKQKPPKKQQLSLNKAATATTVAVPTNNDQGIQKASDQLRLLVCIDSTHNEVEHNMNYHRLLEKKEEIAKKPMDRYNKSAWSADKGLATEEGSTALLPERVQVGGSPVYKLERELGKGALGRSLLVDASLSSAPIAIRVAASKLLQSQSDNNVKLIILDKLNELKNSQEKFLFTRRKSLDIGLELLTPTNVDEVVIKLKKLDIFEHKQERNT